MFGQRMYLNESHHCRSLDQNRLNDCYRSRVVALRFRPSIFFFFFQRNELILLVKKESTV